MSSAPTLAGNTLRQTTYSGFDYPDTIRLVPLLDDGTTFTGNAVLQQGAMALRQATLTVIAMSPSDLSTYRTIYQSRAAVTYVDHDSNSFSVIVAEFTASVLEGSEDGQVWVVNMRLVEADDVTVGGISVGSGAGGGAPGGGASGGDDGDDVPPDPDGTTTFTDITGWTLVFADEFDVDVAEGDILDGSPDGFHTADGRYTFYKSTWTDTTHHGHYDPSIVSIHDSTLDIHIATTGGFPRVCAFTPHPPGSSSKGGLSAGGRFFARIKADAMAGYKGVPMWWADDGIHGEFDGPESNFTVAPRAYMHPTAGVSTGQVAFSYPGGTSWQDWHDYECAWTPGGVVQYWIDGVSIGTTPCPSVPSPLHCNMQFETQLVYTTAGIPDPSVTGHVYIDRLALWVPA